MDENGQFVFIARSAKDKDWGKLIDLSYASISDDNWRNVEPWTGKWKVAGLQYADDTWFLKQSGNTVVSTKDSADVIEGSVIGSNLKGILKSGLYEWVIKLQIFSDGQSFKGTYTGRNAHFRGFMKARRQEKK